MKPMSNIMIRFLYWLNNKTGATKPKQKHIDEQIIYGNVPEWFKDEMSSRPRHQRECFYHPPPEVIHTPHEWIDGESSGRHYGAWRPIEQMTTLSEPFECHEDESKRRERSMDHRTM